MERNKQKLSYKHRVRSELRKKALEYLALHHCEICGERDPLVLDFDHIDRNQKHNAVSRMINDCRPWAEIETEIRKCRILCANCHRRHTAEQLGYWKYV